MEKKSSKALPRPIASADMAASVRLGPRRIETPRMRLSKTRVLKRCHAARTQRHMEHVKAFVLFILKKKGVFLSSQWNRNFDKIESPQMFATTHRFLVISNSVIYVTGSRVMRKERSSIGKEGSIQTFRCDAEIALTTRKRSAEGRRLELNGNSMSTIAYVSVDNEKNAGTTGFTLEPCKRHLALRGHRPQNGKLCPQCSSFSTIPITIQIQTRWKWKRF